MLSLIVKFFYGSLIHLSSILNPDMNTKEPNEMIVALHLGLYTPMVYHRAESFVTSSGVAYRPKD